MPEPTFIEMPDGSLAVDEGGDLMEYDYDALVECCCGPSGHNCEHYFWAAWDAEAESWTIYEKTAPDCTSGCVTTDWTMRGSDPNHWERTVCGVDCGYPYPDPSICLSNVPDPGEPPYHG